MIRISAVVPVYNRAHCVAEALRSILFQTSPADEVILVDDGSTDGLEATIAPFRSKISVIRQANAGVSAARNVGVRAATGDWVTFLDSDDLWTPKRLEILRQDLAQAGSSVSIHLGNAMYQTPTETRMLFDLKPPDSRKTFGNILADPLAFVLSGMTTQPAAIRRKSFEAVGGFDEDMSYFEDTDLFCRLALTGDAMVNGSALAVIRRLPKDSGLTDVEVTKPEQALGAHIRSLEKLEQLKLSPHQSLMVRQKLSGALFRLASLRKGHARLQLLNRAARIHPAPIKGRLKSTLARLYGDWGMQMLLRDRNRLNRTVRT